MGGWTPAENPPPLAERTQQRGPSSAEHAVRIDPVNSPEPDALEIVVRGRWWPGDEDGSAGWRNSEGQALPAIEWRELTANEQRSETA